MAPAVVPARSDARGFSDDDVLALGADGGGTGG